MTATIPPEVVEAAAKAWHRSFCGCPDGPDEWEVAHIRVALEALGEVREDVGECDAEFRTHGRNCGCFGGSDQPREHRYIITTPWAPVEAPTGNEASAALAAIRVEEEK